MSNVIAFPELVFIEINAGTVTGSTITDANGTRAAYADVGKYLYFVNVVEADGTRLGMWDGESRHEALREAHYLACHFRGRVRDLTGEAA